MVICSACVGTDVGATVAETSGEPVEVMLSLVFFPQPEITKATQMHNMA